LGVQSPIERLLRNDPNETGIYIDKLQQVPGFCDDLANAFTNNQYVRDATFVLQEQMREGDVAALCRVLTKRELFSVTVMKFTDRDPSAGVCSILRAIQENALIQIVRFILNLWNSPQVFASFITETSAAELIIVGPHVVEFRGNRDQGARDLTAAFQRNTSIKKLSLSEDTLFEFIPSLRVNELTIQETQSESKPLLLSHLERNYSIRSVDVVRVVRGLVEDYFDDSDKALLAQWAHRNMRFAEFIDNPSTVQTTVWPEALTMASRAGPEATFSSLVAIAGSPFISYHGQRNHKRERGTPSFQQQKKLRVYCSNT